MSEGGRPPAVRRFLRRPILWLAVTAAALPVLNLADERHRNRQDPASGAAVTVPGVAGEASPGGIDVTYRNPVTGQEVETFVGFGGKVAEPAPGAAVTLVVDRDDPENLRLAGDEVPETLDLFSMALLLAAGLSWVTLRQVSVRRSERLAAGAGPAFAMIATIEPPRRLGRRPCLHLWPLDAGPDSPALCAVPVLTTGGLPVGGPAFPVEVKGSPRNLGRVVARAGSTLVWPASRCLLWSWARRGERVLSAAEVAAATTPPFGTEPTPWPTRDPASGTPGRVAPPPPLGAEVPAGSPRPPHRVRTGADWTGFAGGRPSVVIGLLMAVTVLAVAVVTTAVHHAAADDLRQHGVEVVAEVTRRRASSVEVRYRLPGEDRDRTGTVPVDVPGDQKIGLRLPAHVDPRRPERFRFARDPYDAREPVLWAAVPLTGLLAVLVRRRRLWTASARLAERGRWRPATAQRNTANPSVAAVWGPPAPDGADPWVAAEVRLGGGDGWCLAPGRPHGTFDVEVAGGWDPGDAVALRHQGRLLTVTSRARWPRSARPRGRPGRAGRYTVR